MKPEPNDVRATRHADDVRRVDRLDRLANRMDSAFRVPGTNFRVGWDAVLGIVPGVGDTIALGPAAYIYYAAYKMGVPSHKLGRMAFNSGIDYVIGSIPLIGVIFDAGYKSNLKNVAMLKDELATREADAGPAPPVVVPGRGVIPEARGPGLGSQPTSSIPEKK